MDQVKIERASPRQLDQIRSFYDKHGYGYGDLSKDSIVVAMIGEKLIGVGRLCEEHGTLILRGMQVDQDHQKNSVGRAILERLNKTIASRECFVLPWDHLENFYGSIGFQKISSDEAPPHLKDRSEEYYRKHPNIIVMRRRA